MWPHAEPNEWGSTPDGACEGEDLGQSEDIGYQQQHEDEVGGGGEPGNSRLDKSDATTSTAEIQEKVGTVNSVFLVPIGGMSMATGKQGTAGNADLHFTVKGSKKFLDLNLLMSKDFETDWEIEIKK